jgi:hypothetical protein
MITGDREYLFSVLDSVRDADPIDLLVLGDADGADTIALEWAKVRGVNYIIKYADWDKYGFGAGPIRNGWMLDHKPDLVIAFHSSIRDSAGTRDACNQAMQRNIPVVCMDGRCATVLTEQMPRPKKRKR